MDKRKVAVVGLWHLGTVTAACIAEHGNSVIGLDPDRETISKLKKGKMPLYEPGLAELVAEQKKRGRLLFTTSFKSGLQDADFVIIAFDTPLKKDDSPDVSPILRDISGLTPHLRDGVLLVVSSQVPVGTCELIRDQIQKRRPGLRFGIAYVLENLRLGDAIRWLKTPTFLLIGAANHQDLKRAEQLYDFVSAPKLQADLRTAEMTKLALNAFAACQTGFANELGNLCDAAGVDSMRVAEIMRLDPRVGRGAQLRAGLGLGGGSQKRDLRALVALGRKHKLETPLFDAVLELSDNQNRIVMKKLRSIFGGIRGLRLGVLGLTYKAGTSTLRRSTAIEIIGELVKNGASVKAYDPAADLSSAETKINFKRCGDAYSVAESSDALLLLTAWPEFKELNFSKMKSKMSRPVIIDALSALDRDRLTAQGFLYVGIGRGSWI